MDFNTASFVEIWRPWDAESANNGTNDLASNRSSVSVSEETQSAVLNFYNKTCNEQKSKRGAIAATAAAFKLHRNTIASIIKRGEVKKSERGLKRTKKLQFDKIDEFWKNLVRETIHNFYKLGIDPTIDQLFAKLGEVSGDKFPYGRTTLYWLLQQLGFKYQKINKKKVIMENPEMMNI